MKYKIAFFGSSLISAYWNGAATYYRGILKSLHKLGHEITFYEPDAFDRQKHRDIDDPEYAKSVIYPAEESEALKMIDDAREADIIIKANGVGVMDFFLEKEILKLKSPENLIIFWDVDAPATLDSVFTNPENPFKDLIPQFDLILTYGGGQPVVEAYESLSARKCVPVYNALDTDTHFPVPPEDRFKADLAFLGNRLPDREKRVEDFFLNIAEEMPEKQFILGGNGWDSRKISENVKYLGHVYTKDHNALNCSPLAVLNISRDSMAKYGFSPATRVFEAAGAKACIITDYWKGIDHFFEPGKEILIADSGSDVKEILNSLTPEKSAEIGEAAYQKVIARHTYDDRAAEVQKIFEEKLTRKEEEAI